MSSETPTASDAAAAAAHPEQQQQQHEQQQPMPTAEELKVLEKGLEKCELMLAKALDTDVVKSLRDGMDNLGCGTVTSDFFSCKAALNGPTLIGGFDPQNPSIVLFSDVIDKHHLRQVHVSQTVAHELVHAYDHCRVNIDWRNCFHIACSEVRAARLSGDCEMMTEFNRGNFAIGGQGKRCARRRAELSVATHPQCKDVAKDVVDKILNSCYADQAPLTKV